MLEYQVLTSSAKMPTNCWGRYGHVAVVLVDTNKLNPGDTKPRMISCHARGVVRIVDYRYRLHIGGDRSAFSLALKDCIELCDALNDSMALLQDHDPNAVNA